MPRPSPESSGSPDEVDAALRAALYSSVRVDIPPPSTADFLVRWRAASERSAADLVPFPAEAPADPLAFAARSGAAISASTREQIAALVRRLRDDRRPQ
jgi:hypothetical protein